MRILGIDKNCIWPRQTYELVPDRKPEYGFVKIKRKTRNDENDGEKVAAGVPRQHLTIYIYILFI